MVTGEVIIMDTAIIVALITVTPVTLLGVWNAYQGQKIHTLVNSNFTLVKTQLEAALAKIKRLEEKEDAGTTP